MALRRRNNLAVEVFLLLHGEAKRVLAHFLLPKSDLVHGHEDVNPRLVKRQPALSAESRNEHSM